MTESLSKKIKLENDKECNVGITKYRFECDKVSGSIKTVSYDFIVEEVDLEGNVVELKDMPVPMVKKISKVDNNEWFTAFKQSSIIKEYYNEEEIEKVIVKFEEIIEANSGAFSFKMIENKAHRTEIHKLFKSMSQLHSKAANNLIEIHFGKESSRKPMTNWKDLGGDHLEFCLCKSNIDTIQAIEEIARRAKLNSKVFSYAGTKDKKACTIQLVRANRVLAQRLANMKFVYDENREKQIKLGNFKYVKEPLRLGDCFGNRFIVIIRNVNLNSIEDLNSIFQPLQKLGFINYFGMQRFGNSSVGTHDLGKCVVLQKWEEFVNLLLLPRSGDSDQIAHARLNYKTNKDPEQAIRLFPSNCIAEKCVLSHLKHSPTDFHGAFKKIPRNLKTMYAHAFQSYIWNTIVSIRISKYGFELRKGDLILNHLKEVGRNERNVKEAFPIEITDQNINKYTIYDLVLPCPGEDSIYPVNMADDYEELLCQLNITQQDWTSDPQLNLSGSYRHVVGKPIDLEYSVHHYDELAPLHSIFHDDIDLEKKGEHIAIKIGVTLKTSNYVTMLLRQVLE